MSEGTTEAVAIVARLGLEVGDVVGEMGYDDDVDAEFRDAIQDLTTTELVDQDADEVVDGMLLWWRDGDGDLTDTLVDGLTLLADDGVIWLVSPKTGRDGYVEPSEIAEAGRTAGLSQTTNVGSSGDWMVTKLSRARAPRVPRR